MLPFNKIRYTVLNLGLVLGLLITGVAWGAVPALADSGQTGAVYTLSNTPGGNAVVVFNRAGDGTLTPAGTFATGGKGSGSGLGSQGSVTLSRDGRWLFAVNAGSNSVSSFRLRPDGLTLVSQVPSGGEMPISVTNFDDLVYVLNAGSSENIAGFELRKDGSLAPIAGSIRPLSDSGVAPAEIEFSPRGGVLVVTEKGTSKIDTYTVGKDGLANGPMVDPSNGAPRGALWIMPEPTHRERRVA
jgi:6-phosphogluconolactonase